MKRFMKVLFATVLAAVTAFSFAACGGSQAKDISGAKNLADLKGARIAAQSGTFHENAREQIEDVKGDVYKKFDLMYTALISGAIDGYIAEEPTALTVCYQNKNLDYIHLVNNESGFTATDADTAIAIGFKKGGDWADRINPILVGISNEDKNSLMEQCVRAKAGETIETFAVSNAAPATTNGTLKVAMECDYAPFNWTQTDNKNGAVPISSEGSDGLYANGYDVQIAKYIANALGLRLEINAIVWDSLIPGVKAGTYDLIAAGMSPTAERKAEVDFTSNYYSSNLVVIYKKA